MHKRLWIQCVLLLLMAGTASASSAFLAANSPLGEKSLATRFAQVAGDVSAEQLPGSCGSCLKCLAEFFVAPSATASGPNRIYSSRVLMRSAEESGPFHNFPESYNQQILNQGTRTVTPNFWRTAKPGLSNDSIMYRLPGSVNGVEGSFEIGVRPSVSGNTEVINHRFFRPNP